jgi:hypothetical protein
MADPLQKWSWFAKENTGQWQEPYSGGDRGGLARPPIASTIPNARLIHREMACGDGEAAGFRENRVKPSARLLYAGI